MKKSDKLKQQRADIIDSLRAKDEAAEAILAKGKAENRKPTDEEDKQFKALTQEMKDLAVERDRLTARIEEELKNEAATNDTQVAPAVTRPTLEDVQNRSQGIYAAPRVELRNFPMHLAMARGSELNTEQRREREYRAGMFVRAAVFGDARARQWCSDYGVNFQNVMTEGSNPGGGATVPAEFESMVIDNRESFGIARQWTRVVTMASETKTMPKRTGGLTVYYPGENPGSDYTASDKSWTNVTLTAREAVILSKFSRVLSEDSVVDIARDLAQEMGYAQAEAEDAALFNGDGSQTYGGIVGIRTTMVNGIGGASELLGCFDFASNHDTFAEIDVADLAGLMAILPEYARTGAQWYCSAVAKALVFDRLGQAGGGNTKQTIAGKMEDMYAGYPIRVSQKMPTSTADISDTVMLLFGDLKRAVLFGDRRGMSIQVLRELYAAQGLLGILGSWRYDIKTADVGTTAVAGPVVAGVAE